MMNKKLENYIPVSENTSYHNDSVSFEVPAGEIVATTNSLYRDRGLKLKLITATDERKENGCFKIWYVFSASEENSFVIPFIKLKDTEKFPSLTPTIREAWNHERKIMTFFGLDAEGHPDKRPLILHENWPADVFPLRKDFDLTAKPTEAKNKYDFLKVEGEGIYEIPVGPIHAGIIEPGHFRFSMAGEEIVLLEPKLGYVHKGTEKLFENLSIDEGVLLSERISGDSSFSHSLAFCQAVEKLANISISGRTKYLRTIFAELERLANHIGDIGAIMTDTGFNFGGANGARLREKIMQINEGLTGSRFLRGMNTVGGLKKETKPEVLWNISKDLSLIEKDFSEVIEIAKDSPSLMNRLKTTGKLYPDIAKDLGVIGVAGKAVGLLNDARAEHPYAAYGELRFNDISTEKDGDVYARFNVRIKEVHSSIKLIQDAIRNIPGKKTFPENKIKLEKNSLAVGIVEGWRGDIVYFITTDANGNIARVAARDPSFINWSALPYAGLGNIVPDFPLINKSFNLSYSGNDL